MEVGPWSAWCRVGQVVGQLRDQQLGGHLSYHGEGVSELVLTPAGCRSSSGVRSTPTSDRAPSRRLPAEPVVPVDVLRHPTPSAVSTVTSGHPSTRSRHARAPLPGMINLPLWSKLMLEFDAC